MGMEFSLRFHKKAGVVGRRPFKDLPKEYPAVNPLKVPLELTIGCVKDLEQILAIKDFITVKDLVISPFCE